MNVWAAARNFADAVLESEPGSTPADIEGLAAFLESVVDDWLSQERRPCSVCGKPYLGHDHAPCASRLSAEYRNLFGGTDAET